MFYLIEHSKLVEAFALLVILISWGAEWVATQNFQKNMVRLDNAILLERESHNTKQSFNNLMLEGAVTRAVLSDTTITDRVNAWNSVEVRAAWFRRFMARTESYDRSIPLITEYADRYGVEKLEELDDAKRRLKEAKNRLAKVTSQKMPAPDPEQFSILDAVNMDYEMRMINGAILRSAGKVKNYLYRSRNFLTSIQFYTFIFGSLLLFLAKILEWHDSRRSIFRI